MSIINTFISRYTCMQTDTITYVGRNLWICIHGSACAICGSIVCAEIHGCLRNLWIAQGSITDLPVLHITSIHACIHTYLHTYIQANMQTYISRYIHRLRKHPWISAQTDPHCAGRSRRRSTDCAQHIDVGPIHIQTYIGPINRYTDKRTDVL